MMAADVPEPTTTNVWSTAGLITLVVVGIWLVAAYPAHRIDEWYGLEGLTYAGLLVLVPGWVVLVALDVYRVADSPLARMGVAMSTRMFVAMGGYLFLRGIRPEFGLRNFGLWLITFYIATLAIETWHTTRHMRDEQPPPTEPDAE